MWWVAFAICAALSWGFYGPVLAKGQHALPSPLQALLCVGGAYFLIGILFPIGALGSKTFAGFNSTGVVNAGLGGILGALGAICIIYAFRNGGLPAYVMPIVFGGAPIINVIVSMAMRPPKTAPNPLLWVGMALVPIGAGIVLYYKPE
ncbi:MAG TPA: hypothetical protein VKS01_09055 [Bryobacteraceae bacterium]|nr:hypothetical protein [Bryobacteraceae bacterium]